jgi:hypothetical protein
VDQAAQNRDRTDNSALYGILNVVFLAWFMLELMLRFAADGPRIFTSQFRNWNIFDLIVVIADLVDICIDTMKEASPFLVLRLVRTLRIFKTLRVVRLFGCAKKLRLMVRSSIKAFASLFWALVLLFLLVFVCSIFILQSVTSYLHDLRLKPVLSVHEIKEYQVLGSMFGSWVETVHTLYKAVSGGILWGEISDNLLSIHWLHALVLCLYVFLFLFVAANIITGVFVEIALRSVREGSDEAMEAQLGTEKSELSMIKAIFVGGSKDCSGLLTLDSLEMHLKDERVCTHLKTLNFDHSEVEGLFQLMDIDASGTVPIEEFMHGLLRLKGGTRDIDFCTLLHENKILVDRVRDCVKHSVTSTDIMRKAIMRSNKEHLQHIAALLCEAHVDINEAAGATVMPMTPKDDNKTSPEPHSPHEATSPSSPPLGSRRPPDAS